MIAAMSLLCGVVFGVGLAMSGMTDITKVIGFLDLFGNWDPSLAFVMGGGLLVTLPFFQLGVGRLSAPLFDAEFRIPTSQDIDLPLVSGAVMFGVGWGLVGLCPGPAIATLAYLNTDILLFVVCMLVGLFVGDIAKLKMMGATA